LTRSTLAATIAAMSADPSVTQLLARWRQGDATAMDELTRLVYDDLKRLAARQLRGERQAHTLTPTALVSEAFLRMAGSDAPSFEDRVHFFATAARHMRHILVDFARARASHKRGAGKRPVTLDERQLVLTSDAMEDLLDLDEALSALAAVDERKARVVELHFFGGMSLLEVASALGIHGNTVLRDLRLAEAWLNRHLTRA
jgi:RNA polymerase sigma factor (TIGR02999 family)